MTSLSPLLDAAPVTQLHAAAAFSALMLGPFALWRRRRDRLHKALGYVWIILMALTATSSFWIHSMPLIGPFGPIHLLSIWTLLALALGLAAAIRGEIARHRGFMRSLYLVGLGGAGVFTLLPGRVLHRALFGEDTPAALFLVFALAALALAMALRGRLRETRRKV